MTGIRGPDGVLITGVYGSGKSSVAAEIAHVLEQRRQPYALLDLDRPVAAVAHEVMAWLGWL